MSRAKWSIPDQLRATLEKSGLNKEQINIVVHNLEELVSTKKITSKSVEIVVDNLVKDDNFRSKFLANPTSALKELPIMDPSQ